MLLAFEGFDHWASVSGQQSTIYAGGMGTSGIGRMACTSNFGGFSAAVFGGKKFDCWNGGYFCYDNGVANFNPLIIGFRFSVNGNTSTQTLLSLIDTGGLILGGGGTTHCGLGMNAAGRLFLFRGNTATVLATGNTFIPINGEYWIELRLQVGASSTCEVRLNGFTEILITGTNTQMNANGWQYINIGNIGGNTLSLDDLYICDTTGGAPFNDFIGGTGGLFTGFRVETQFPTANDSVTWTPNASTNVSRVNETATDADTTYNSTVTHGAIDMYTHGAMVTSPTTIFALKVQAIIRKEDTPVQNARTKFISGAAAINGFTRTLNTVYQAQEDYYINDPNTGAPWANPAAINATKIGYENV